MLDPIYNLFGWLMKFIYDNLSFNNYGIAIIIFTIFTKLILTPLTIKQLKSTSNNAEMQKELAEIQKLFKGNREKIAEETQKLYTKYGVSPMSGCLPMLIQFPIIIALYAVVREPITYILKKAPDIINSAGEALGISAKSGYFQLELMNRLAGDPENLRKVQSFSASDIINFNFLGINLGMTPVINFNTIFSDPGLYLPLLLIPVLAAVTTYIQSMLMQKTNSRRSGGDASGATAGMMKGMNILMPAMILIFAFQVPASLGLYWIIGNIFQIGQQFVLGKFMNKNNSPSKDQIIEVKGKRK